MIAIEEEVMLVDKNDQVTGTMEKMAVHREGLLHRAFSVFIFNSRGDMLLQQRAMGKYHSGGLWTNTCCSHPRPKEETRAAAARRLEEEMGFVTPLKEVFTFTYRAELDQGLTEHELDHVFTGVYNGPVHLNPAEVNDYCYKPISVIQHLLDTHPQQYTSWFKIAFPLLKDWLVQNRLDEVRA